MVDAQLDLLRIFVICELINLCRTKPEFNAVVCGSFKRKRNHLQKG